MPIRLFYFVLFIGLYSIDVHGQAEICKWIKVFESPVQLDSLSVDTRSIHFPNDSSIVYEYNYSRGIVIIQQPEKDSVLICFKTIPFSFHNTYSNRTLAQYDSNARFKPSVIPNSWD